MRRRYVQNRDGELVEVGGTSTPMSAAVQPDFSKPFRSMVDGTVITGRRQYREHLRRHGMQIVGNDTQYTRPKALGIPDADPQGRKELIRRQVDAMTQKEWKRAVQRTVDNWKWNSRSN